MLTNKLVFHKKITTKINFKNTTPFKYSFSNLAFSFDANLK